MPADLNKCMPATEPATWCFSELCVGCLNAAYGPQKLERYNGCPRSRSWAAGSRAQHGRRHAGDGRRGGQSCAGESASSGTGLSVRGALVGRRAPAVKHLADSSCSELAALYERLAPIPLRS